MNDEAVARERIRELIEEKNDLRLEIKRLEAHIALLAKEGAKMRLELIETTREADSLHHSLLTAQERILTLESIPHPTLGEALRAAETAAARGAENGQVDGWFVEGDDK